MEDLHTSAEERITQAHSNQPSAGHMMSEKPGQRRAYVPPSVTSSEEDDLELQKLGYKPVLARGWGTFDNFACSFSALYCIGGIRVLFYIALSAGGPAAM
jgi:hypothetical protein